MQAPATGGSFLLLPPGWSWYARTAAIQNKRATVQVPMLPATGTEAKCNDAASYRTEAKCRNRKSDTDGIAAITGHNDDSMGKFSYSG